MSDLPETNDVTADGWNKERLTNHYRDQLEKVGPLEGSQDTSLRADVLPPDQVCLVVPVIYQETKFDMHNKVVNYFVHCPSPAHAIREIVLPCFTKWQAGKGGDGYPKMIINRSTQVKVISLKSYLALWRPAEKYGCLHEGTPAAPSCFLLARHKQNGLLEIVSKEGSTHLNKF